MMSRVVLEISNTLSIRAMIIKQKAMIINSFFSMILDVFSTHDVILDGMYFRRFFKLRSECYIKEPLVDRLRMKINVTNLASYNFVFKAVTNNMKSDNKFT